MTRRGTIVLLCVVVTLLGAAADVTVLTLARGPLQDLVGSRGAVCGGVVDDGVRDRGHRPEGTVIKYPTSPPTSGPHYPTPASPQIWFYHPGSAPRVETLVHNLEHGYTIVWYDSSVRGRQLDDLRELAGTLARHPGKVIVAPWDNGHGRLPRGKHVALAHWGATEGHRQYCRQVSTPTITAFVKRYPPTDAPEPSAP